MSERRGTEVEIGLQPWWLTEGAPQSHLGQEPEVSGRDESEFELLVIFSKDYYGEEGWWIIQGFRSLRKSRF